MYGFFIMEIKHYKKKVMQENMTLFEIGNFKNLPVIKSTKHLKNDNMQIFDTNVFCEVFVIKNSQSITLARECILKKMNPAVINVVTDQFNGSNIPSSEGMYDDTINLRTNFYKTLNQGFYPLKKNEVVYSPFITVIRHDNFNFLNPQQFFRVALITATPISEPKLENDSFGLDDYISTKDTIENIFQVAIQHSHDVLILTDFGCTIDKNPISDIVDIFNICILKYGSFFKYIIFSINTTQQIQIDEAIYFYFFKNIIRPQDLISNTNPSIQIDNNQTVINQMPNQIPNQIIPNQMPNQMISNQISNQMVQNQMIPNQMSNQMTPNQMPNQMIPNQMIPNQMQNQMIPNQMQNQMSNQMSNQMMPNQMSNQMILK